MADGKLSRHIKVTIFYEEKTSRGSVNIIVMGEKAAGAQIPLINPPPTNLTLHDTNLTLHEVEKSLETP